MKLQSTNDLDNREIPQSLWKLIDLNEPVTDAFFVSAYCSTEIIEAIVEWAISNKDDSCIINLQIYLDYAGSDYNSDENKRQKLDQIAATLSNKALFTTESGIYLVQYGNLFHSKGYAIRSKTKTKFGIGSLNLTISALKRNEELLFIMEHDSKDERSQVICVTDQFVNEYIPKIRNFYSKRIPLKSKDDFSPLSLRDVLLRGNIYYEQQENAPLYFKLNLPEEVLEIGKNIHDLLEGGVSNSLSIQDLLDEKYKVAKTLWKKYCIQTCYGYWNPNSLNKSLLDTLDEKSKEKKVFYRQLKERLKEHSFITSLTEKAYKVFEEINVNLRVKINQTTQWEDFVSGNIKIRWEQWLSTLIQKLNNDDFFEYLCQDVHPAIVPDVWGGNGAQEFEESFLNNILYVWNKSSTKESSNIIAWNIKNIINYKRLMERQNIEISSPELLEELKEEIENWLRKNHGVELFAEKNESRYQSDFGW